MPPPGASSETRRSSSSGSPKCMKRPPLQVPIAVAVGCIAPFRLEALLACPQRRLQPPEGVGEQLAVGLRALLVRRAGPDRLEDALRLPLHPAGELLQLVHAQDQVLAPPRPQLGDRG